MGPDKTSAAAFRILGGIRSTPVAFLELREFIIFKIWLSLKGLKVFKALNGAIICDSLDAWMCGSSSIRCLIVYFYFFCNIYIEVI